MPTGEVTLDGARAGWPATSPAATLGWRPNTDAARDGRGINRMMEMVNGSRFGVALMGLGIHRRSFLEAAIYAARRTQWGQRIDEYPLVRETLVDLLVDLEAGMAITYECAGVRPDGRRRRTRVACCAASSSRWPRCDHPGGPLGGQQRARGLRRQRLHGATGRWPASSATPSATPSGRAPRTSCAIDVRRAMRGEQAHLALFARVERALDAAAGHTVLAGAPTPWPGHWPASAGPSPIEGLDDDLALLQSRRLAELLADTAEGALLVEEAAWSLDRDGDARKAAVARRFITRTLAERPLRGLLDTDRSVLDHFAAITRYGPIDAGDLVA